MPYLDLCSQPWTLQAVGNNPVVPASLRAAVIPATVPGCVHTDLIRGGHIPDPTVGFNELDIQWIGLADWVYRTTFTIPPDLLAYERLDLVCESLDTIAEVALNGRHVGAAANMFHPHRFDLRPALQPGTNQLSITFRSPLNHIRAEEARLGKRPVNGDWDPYIFIRKPACNFGWDWAPKVATSGVCAPIRLEAWRVARIASVRPLTRRTDQGWLLDLHVELEWTGVAPPAEPLHISASLRDDSSAPVLTADRFATPGERSILLTIPVTQPNLWWPRGYGPQPLYTLHVSLTLSPTQEPLDSRSHLIAFRDVRLNTDPDDRGNNFHLEINGTPIFCKGANWIPEGLFPSDRPPDKIRHRIRQAADANMNMLRVWGGGMYESDAFYDECDRLGMMVWQDFMFACACYPEEQPFPTLVEAEARHQIARLSAHPSVVLWCGGNECVWAYESWGHAPTDTEGPWKKRVAGKTWGRGYYFDLLPRLLLELDPTRPYWPNSPFSGTEGDNPNQTTRGDRHTWDARAEGYKSIIPRFCSEFGHQSPPNLPTLARVLTPEDLKLNSAALNHRQRATGGTARHIDECLAEHFPPPKDFAEWHHLAQLMQARALELGIGALAAARPRCMGALIWQLNDAWPGFSWSLIDSDGTPKPAYYAVQRAFGGITP